MRWLRLVLIVILFVLFLISLNEAVAGPVTITVTGADSVVEKSPVYSSNLVDTISIDAKISVQYANSNAFIFIPEIPGSLETVIGYIPERVNIEYSKSIRGANLEYPADLLKNIYQYHVFVPIILK